MTTSVAGTGVYEDWRPVEESLARRVWRSISSFTRKKPLGAACGLVVLFFVVIGDFVPETVNKASSVAGFGHPVPYLADVLQEHTTIVYRYTAEDLRHRLAGPSSTHLLGTDQLGRDIFSRLLYGARVAVVVSIGAVFISETMGAAIGIAVGYYGGWLDKIAYRLVDVFQALPGLVVLITIFGVFGSGLWQMVFVIGFLGGPPSSRIIRGQTLSVMASPYIEAERVLGASDMRIMVHHILPNVFALVILSSTVRFGILVLVEASLSFLGFGMPPPFPSWGQMLSVDGQAYMRTQPGLAIYPGIAIAMLVFSYNLWGDALRDVLDPRLRGSR